MERIVGWGEVSMGRGVLKCVGWSVYIVAFKNIFYYYRSLAV